MIYSLRFLLVLIALIAFQVIGWANTANFTWTAECEGAQTFFVSTSSASSGTIAQYKWDFDNDGFFDEATGATASWLFDSAGTWTVGHQIITSTGQTASVYLAVVVNDVPDVTYAVTEVCKGNATEFTDLTEVWNANVASRNWDLDNDSQFDDGSTALIDYTYGSASTYTAGLRVTTDSGCVASVYKTFSVHPNPTVNFTFEDVCIGDTTDFHGISTVATGFVSSYQWEMNGDGFYNDATGQNVSNQFINAGSHQVGLRVTTDRGCVKDTSILVTIAPLPIVNFSFDGECMETEVQFTNLSTTQIGTPQYTWSFGQGPNSGAVNPTHIYNSFGTFTVTLTTEVVPYGCVSSLSQQITIFPSPKSEFNFTEVCLGNTTEFDNESQGQGSTINFNHWYFGDGDDVYAENPSHLYEEPGTYQVTLIVTSTNDCFDTIVQEVNVWELPDATISANGPLAFCRGGSVDIGVNLDAGEHALWSTGVATSSINVTEPGEYEALVYDEHNCQDRDEVNVAVWELPNLDISNDTTVSLGYDVPLWVGGAAEYVWEPTDYLDNPYSTNPTVVSPLQEVTYTVTATDENGCVSDTNVTIFINADYLLEPVNLFTPNGDGKNDYFKIKNAELYTDCELVVYNRWGVEVYNSSSYQNDWDGTSKGQELPEGSYYYVMRCAGTDIVYDGSVSILRVQK